MSFERLCIINIQHVIMQGWGGSWNCLRTKFSLCTNFILQKLLMQMVNNSSLTASCDRRHLNFIHLSNLYNAYRFFKKCTLTAQSKESGGCNWLTRGVEFWMDILSKILIVKDVWCIDRVTLLTSNLSSQYNLYGYKCFYTHLSLFHHPVNFDKILFHFTDLGCIWECRMFN